MKGKDASAYKRWKRCWNSRAVGATVASFKPVTQAGPLGRTLAEPRPAGKGKVAEEVCMYAVIEASGGQLKVVKDQVIDIDLIDDGLAATGKKITFDKVLLIAGAEAKAAQVGQPYVAGATVTAEVIEGLVKGDKLRIQYFQAKKGSRRRTGHRQKYTKVKITSING